MSIARADSSPQKCVMLDSASSTFCTALRLEPDLLGTGRDKSWVGGVLERGVDGPASVSRVIIAVCRIDVEAVMRDNAR